MLRGQVLRHDPRSCLLPSFSHLTFANPNDLRPYLSLDSRVIDARRGCYRFQRSRLRRRLQRLPAPAVANPSPSPSPTVAVVSRAIAVSRRRDPPLSPSHRYVAVPRSRLQRDRHRPSPAPSVAVAYQPPSRSPAVPRRRRRVPSLDVANPPRRHHLLRFLGSLSRMKVRACYCRRDQLPSPSHLVFVMHCNLFVPAAATLLFSILQFSLSEIQKQVQGQVLVPLILQLGRDLFFFLCSSTNSSLYFSLC